MEINDWEFTFEGIKWLTCSGVIAMQFALFISDVRINSVTRNDRNQIGSLFFVNSVSNVRVVWKRKKNITIKPVMWKFKRMKITWIKFPPKLLINEKSRVKIILRAQRVYRKTLITEE